MFHYRRAIVTRNLHVDDLKGVWQGQKKNMMWSVVPMTQKNKNKKGGRNKERRDQTSPPFLARARQQLPRLRVLLVLIARVRPQIPLPPVPLHRRRRCILPIIAPRPPAAPPRLVLVLVQRRRRGRERRLQRHPHRFAAHRPGPVRPGARTRARGHRRRAHVRLVLPRYGQCGGRRLLVVVVERLANGAERRGRLAVAPPLGVTVIGILPTLRACGGWRSHDDDARRRGGYHDGLRRGGRGRVVSQRTA
ncbi:hypothetical protein BJV78DRAFT_1263194 [Lactifluus subvellereus]|nr:hypothetical protein BJV78DRAFT_1263194 [Lactifluus subvellereus]